MVKHRMEKPHVGLSERVQKERMCTALQCGPPESACLRGFSWEGLVTSLVVYLLVLGGLLSTAEHC